jgi:hypothetical protein
MGVSGRGSEGVGAAKEHRAGAMPLVVHPRPEVLIASPPASVSVRI